MRHRIDPVTGYCTRCGKSLRAIFEARDSECRTGDNVVAISHLLSRRRFNELLGITDEEPAA